MAKRTKAARGIPLVTYLETKFQLGVSGTPREIELDQVCAAIKRLLADVDFVRSIPAAALTSHFEEKNDAPAKVRWTAWKPSLHL